MERSERESVEYWRDLYGGMAKAMNIIRSHVGIVPLEASNLASSGVPTPNGHAIEICRAIDEKIKAPRP